MAHLTFYLVFLKLPQVDLLPMNVSKITECMTNGVDPDQTPRIAASDLGLHCLLKPVCSNT